MGVDFLCPSDPPTLHFLVVVNFVTQRYSFPSRADRRKNGKTAQSRHKNWAEWSPIAEGKLASVIDSLARLTVRNKQCYGFALSWRWRRFLWRLASCILWGRRMSWGGRLQSWRPLTGEERGKYLWGTEVTCEKTWLLTIRLQTVYVGTNTTMTAETQHQKLYARKKTLHRYVRRHAWTSLFSK